MKKMILVLSMMLISASVYAIEYSAGITAPGFGLGIFRGEDATDRVKDLEDDNDAKKVFSPSFAPAIQLDFMIEFLPFLALETGIGWSYSSIIYETKETAGVKTHLTFARNELTIPIMIRGQYEADKFVAYGAVGVKLGIPLADDYYHSRTLKDGEETDDSKKKREKDDKTYSDLAMDIAFALGGEYKITDSHYVGLRLGYDLNVISPLNAKEMADLQSADEEDYKDFYQDNFNVSLTYRYAFNSVW